MAVAAVEHVGVGEIFVVAGQSNSANYGEEMHTNCTGQVAAFDGSKWLLARDPMPGATGNKGSFMSLFGDAMQETFHVPIGIVALGVGATSVREWLPSHVSFHQLPTLTGNVVTVGHGEWELTGRLFDVMTGRLRTLGGHGFRAILRHQGESDARQADPERTLPGPLYREFLETIVVSLAKRSAGRPPGSWPKPVIIIPMTPGHLKFATRKKLSAQMAGLARA